MDYRSILFYVRELFFPFGCAVCGKPLMNSKEAYQGLCGKCTEFFALHFSEEKRCVFCGKPLVTEKESCLLCRKRGSEESGVYSESIVKLRLLFPYTGKYHSLLEAYKFKKSLGVGNFFVQSFNRALNDFGSGMEIQSNYEEIAWVPIPPRPGKIKKQGWDQVQYLSKLLNKEFKQYKALGCNADSANDMALGSQRRFPVRHCLKRLRSRSQKELNLEERKINLKGRIVCVKKAPLTVILFDDVFTTGATMDECAQVLLKGGARKVYGVCLFYD